MGEVGSSTSSAELQAHVEGDELVLDEALRGRIEHYAIDFGRGGWQTFFRQLLDEVERATAA